VSGGNLKSFLKQKFVSAIFFFKQKNKNAIFASAKIKKLPKNWHYVLFSKLNVENCKDYEVIYRAMQKLGYISDFLV
jgi:hypothetical protein